jgi:hypothetical protein
MSTWPNTKGHLDGACKGNIPLVAPWLWPLQTRKECPTPDSSEDLDARRIPLLSRYVTAADLKAHRVELFLKMRVCETVMVVL